MVLLKSTVRRNMVAASMVRETTHLMVSEERDIGKGHVEVTPCQAIAQVTSFLKPVLPSNIPSMILISKPPSFPKAISLGKPAGSILCPPSHLDRKPGVLLLWSGVSGKMGEGFFLETMACAHLGMQQILKGVGA